MLQRKQNKKHAGFNGKKIVSIAMAGLMVISMMPTQAYAQSLEDSAIPVDLTQLVRPASEVLKDKLDAETANIAKLRNYKADDMVTVIVDVNVKSTLDEYATEGTQLSASDFLCTNSAIVETTAQKIEKVADKAQSVTDGEVLYQYDTVYTGFSMNVRYGDLEKLQKMAGVNGVYLATEYNLPPETTTVGDGTNMVSSREMIHTSEVQTGVNEYTGTGMLVAILDTGLDYNHEAFAKAPTGAAVSAAQMTTKLSSLSLASETAFTEKNPGMTLSASANNTDKTNIYHSQKVPYGFDYNDSDADCIPVHTENHGTHVAGTVVGSSTTVLGVAPNAQVMSMKVFNDKGSTNDAVLIASLDDAVKLGAEAINMSLGSPAGFKYDSNVILQTAYEGVEKAGINLDVSAGNNYSGTYNDNYGGYTPTANPDNGVVGSPSTLLPSLSVASLENINLNGSNYISLPDKDAQMGYIDNGPDAMKLSTIAAGTYDFVNCGKGTVDDFAKVNVKGKIALVQRGDVSFSVKEANAVAAEAAALIVYNNAAGTISMSISDYKIPAVSITMDDGITIAATATNGVGQIVLHGTESAALPNPQAWEMSDFSSWGTTPDLRIKPEITMPGGNIYSAYYVEGGKSVSGLMSGTSMAAPHMTGASAVVREYLKKTQPGLSAVEVAEVTNKLVMSTANPIEESDGMDETENDPYYSVRKQGAGLVNLRECVEAPAYLEVKGCNRPKAELGYNTDGVFSYTFMVHNMSDKALSLPVTTTLQVEAWASAENGTNIALQRDVILEEGKDYTITYEGTNVADGKVSAPAKGTDSPEVKVTITLTEATKTALNAGYPNGFFVEGYTMLDKDAEVNYSIPFLGFCGDWGKGEIFGNGTKVDYKNKKTTPIFETGDALYATAGQYYYLGQNYFHSAFFKNEPQVWSKDYVAISPDSALSFTGAGTETYTLRGMSKFTYEVFDAAGNVVSSFEGKDYAKSFYYASQGRVLGLEELNNVPTFDGTDANGDMLPNGKYTIKLSGTVAGTDTVQTTEWPVTLDDEAPTISTATKFYVKDGCYYMYVSIKENDHLAGFQIGGYIKDEKGQEKAVGIKNVAYQHLDSEKLSDGSYAGLYKLGTVADFESVGLSVSKLYVDTYDFAMNETTKDINFSTTPGTSTGGGTIVVTPPATTDPVGPAPVDEAPVVVSNKTANTVAIQWNASENATGYEVYRKTANGEYELVGTVEGGATNFVDSSAVTGVTYTYMVKPFVTNGEEKVYGEATEIDGVVSNVPAKTTVKATSTVKDGKNIMKVNFKKVEGATKYMVYRSNRNVKGSFILVGTSKDGSFTDSKKINNNEQYYYKVRAVRTVDGRDYKGEFSKVIKVNVKSN